MNQANSPVSFETQLRTMQIIAGAILAGAGGFLLLAVGMRADAMFPAAANATLITYGLIGAGAIAALASQVAPGMLTTSGRLRILQSAAGQSDEPLLALYQKQMIVGLALAEGATFLVVTAFLVEVQLVSLIASLLFMGFLMAQFPTRRGVVMWLAEQSDWLQRGL